ncbi:MAG: response regulator [Phycisphaerae bacterium]|nr:response regulator [Phycisphaerae bacterium]
MQYPGLQSSVQSKKAPAAQPNRTTRGRILVVDDEEDIVELVTLNLVREGYDVLAASTGEQAIELARARQPDLAILDLMLPGIDGLEMADDQPL